MKRTRNIDNLTGQYVFLLGAYGALYIINWIYRYFAQPHYLHWIPLISGIVQTLLYADFFYYYFQTGRTTRSSNYPLDLSSHLSSSGFKGSTSHHHSPRKKELLLAYL